MRPVILVFAKAPVPGRVKTRLLPALSPAECAALHERFVWTTLANIKTLQPLYDIELHTDTATDAWQRAGVPQVLQSAGDLGLKMLNALQLALAEGRPRVLIVGSDSPTLPPALLSELLESPADVALGPTEDGGYYAISCRRTHPRMFAGVAWSTPMALAQTSAACEAAGLTVAQGPQWFDVDEPADLQRLPAELLAEAAIFLPRSVSNRSGTSGSS